MDSKDYQDLIAFLSKKFESFDDSLDDLRKETREGFANVKAEFKDVRAEIQDVRKELKDTRAELKEDNACNLRQMGVLIEAQGHKIDIVIEGQQDIRRVLATLRDDHERLAEKTEKLDLRHLAHINDANAHSAR